MRKFSRSLSFSITLPISSRCLGLLKFFSDRSSVCVTYNLCWAVNEKPALRSHIIYAFLLGILHHILDVTIRTLQFVSEFLSFWSMIAKKGRSLLFIGSWHWPALSGSVHNTAIGKYAWKDKNVQRNHSHLTKVSRHADIQGPNYQKKNEANPLGPLRKTTKAINKLWFVTASKAGPSRFIINSGRARSGTSCKWSCSILTNWELTCTRGLLQPITPKQIAPYNFPATPLEFSWSCKVDQKKQR